MTSRFPPVPACHHVQMLNYIIPTQFLIYLMLQNHYWTISPFHQGKPGIQTYRRVQTTPITLRFFSEEFK